jgi:heme-degrading monooxygenase HmoA
MIARTPEPPYYAVIFTNWLSPQEGDDYSETAEHMEQLAMQQEGYLGLESVRDGLGITISYWDSLDAIRRWKETVDHLQAQRKGRESWYSEYKVRICKVEKDYAFERKS